MTFVVRNASPTVVWDVRVVVTEKHPSIQGWFFAPQPIGGEMTSLTATAQLDSARGSGRVPLEWTRDPHDPEAARAWNWPCSVDDNDMLSVDLIISAGSGAHEWHVEIDVSTTGDRRRTVKLPALGAWISSSSEECQPLEGSWGV